MSKCAVDDSAQLELHWSDDDWGVEIPLDDDEEIVDQEEGPGIFAKLRAVLRRLFRTNDNNEITAESRSIEAPLEQVYIEEPAICECQPLVIPSYVNDFRIG